MALTYAWKLTGLKKGNTESAQDVVIGTRWELTGTDEDGNSGTFSGATPFKLENVEFHNFVPYENLDQDTVIGWIQAEVVGGYKDHVEQNIARQIEAVKSQVKDVQATDFPWAEPVVEPEAHVTTETVEADGSAE
jgi:hypothetical protein